MGAAVTYAFDAGIAAIGLDDGKANALSPTTLRELDAALDQAERDGAVVLLSGRPERFSAGFDLRVLSSGGPEAVGMLQSGFELAHRMLAFPRPILVACTGHAIAMGAFLLLSADYRIGIAGGDHRIVVNEVAIGLTLPRAAVEICRHRLTPSHFPRAVHLAEEYSPADAVAAGFLDEVVPPEALTARSYAVATRLATLDAVAFEETKRRSLGRTLATTRSAMDADTNDLGLGAE